MVNYVISHNSLQLIVATNEEEVSRLDVLYDKGLQNKVPGLALVDRKEISEIEPYCTVSF